ncbi:CDP-6-deoxy-delta-3,4-glucoseen reductase [Kerstersia gyiorum]|uniref:CDP-6-deoxy-delta-3,4-glucoseen reductase n=1 Tax=Kerstersia gyiorum TaxID=206506 RepID=UPI0020A1E01D|nr:CDP-6-deoxy-delta-3,4-glucoseen reductase [Kerstersia gyiorum]MCP1633129.1 CDP-4-dehydro-6-deoxyglucose reductase [Kerstersia gyiorum]MCP1636424.1 CDP-4-dehydro-6-deoxyglucose reductase [Kerstersia gyiorum]MCP1670323.1 CDP-4-dehydro-6-deoxyglucose reductase [Kerstersia gyiorum]MCP1680355.1 CDP-4-dehydro-6-deoxyglucose reductase [Kerstersia gyiorum]MCP1682648.1 CDP-4-dehydro-6-deoxyglucose reductase [Kerstersia gyiorum]
MSHHITVLPANHAFSAEGGQNLLDAALAAGIVLPYSCRNGACSSCKGKVVSGSYDAGGAVAQSLPASDIAAGYTLFCQVTPTSDMVIESHQVRLATDIEIRRLPVRVMGMERPVPDVTILTLQLPATENFRYYAGQYVDIILKDGTRRSYSMASAPGQEKFLELHLRHVPGGLFTDHVFGVGDTQMRLKEILRIEGPQGSFFLREEDDAPIVMLCSGTGFAPVQSMVEHMRAQGLHRKVRLYWGGRRPGDLYHDARARAWAEQLPDLTYIPVVSDALPEDNWQGRRGWVHEAVLEDLPDLSAWQVYACGTPAMVEAARRDFHARAGLSEAQFFSDAFTNAADLAALRV